MTCETCREPIPARRVKAIEELGLPKRLCLDCRESYDAHGGIPVIDLSGEYAESYAAFVAVMGVE